MQNLRAIDMYPLGVSEQGTKALLKALGEDHVCPKLERLDLVTGVSDSDEEEEEEEYVEDDYEDDNEEEEGDELHDEGDEGCEEEEDNNRGSVYGRRKINNELIADFLNRRGRERSSIRD